MNRSEVCTFNRTGGYCSWACPDCDRRMAARQVHTVIAARCSLDRTIREARS